MISRILTESGSEFDISYYELKYVLEFQNKILFHETLYTLTWRALNDVRLSPRGSCLSNFVVDNYL